MLLDVTDLMFINVVIYTYTHCPTENGYLNMILPLISEKLDKKK